MPTVAVDAYVFDVLMADLIAHDRQPSAFVLYLSIWRLTDGGRKKSAPISLRSLSEQTGLSKRAIQDAADRLERRQLISIERQMPTAVPVYRLHKPWERRQELGPKTQGSKAQRPRGQKAKSPKG